MGLFFGIVGVAVFFFFWAISRSGTNNGNWSQMPASSGGLNVAFQGNGKPARAILLYVDSVGVWKRNNGQRFDVRNASIDIEEPNGAPYVMDNASLHTPPNLVRDALPGSTMEVRIRGNRVFIVGPDVGYAQGAVRTS